MSSSEERFRPTPRCRFLWTSDFADKPICDLAEVEQLCEEYECEVGRLRRVRARNLVARLRLLFQKLSRKTFKTRRHDGKFIIGLTKPRLTLWTLDVADRIEAKYLRGEKGFV